MGLLKIMSREHGDMRHAFDPAETFDKAESTEPPSVTAARSVFQEFMDKKYIAFRQLPDGSHVKIKSFQPDASAIVMVPQLVGG